ncbi:phage holin family protein [Bacillus sp. KH172YL63]|uniref:phage holin family protein n=1 Tax=Bacillus sp. KH172YL63 TaxID=2709784 RepID=UPI0013E47861|nr:phage holin family protein [Bacillus sp. KH172YL63]BCB03851.1 hypothetical protein KH172YL63_19840 [Bacillus sp. KH172YL63]
MIENLLNGISIDPQVTVLVPILWVLGYAFKRTPHVPDWLIIWVLLGVSVVVSGWTLGFDLNGISNGFIATGIAITTHQSVKQTFFNRVSDRNKRDRKI